MDCWIHWNGIVKSKENLPSLIFSILEGNDHEWQKKKQSQQSHDKSDHFIEGKIDLLLICAQIAQDCVLT